MFWTPEKAWMGKACYIIGGGPSLRGFDFGQLTDENVIGCNGAYTLGAGIVDYVVLVDRVWFKPNDSDYERRQKELKDYVDTGGIVVSNLPWLETHGAPEWVNLMRRKPKGVGGGNTLGFNASAGATALCLAVLLGAVDIRLLGFDMKLSAEGKRKNWHDEDSGKPKVDVYRRFIRGMEKLASDLERDYPGVAVRNINNDSELTTFETRPMTALFSRDRAKQDITTQYPVAVAKGLRIKAKAGGWYDVYGVDGEKFNNKSLREKDLGDFLAQVGRDDE